MRPRDPVLNVGQNNKININIPVGTDQLKIAINRVSRAAQCAELLFEWIETVNLKTVEAWNIVKLAAAASWWPVACGASNAPSWRLKLYIHGEGPNYDLCVAIYITVG